MIVTFTWDILKALTELRGLEEGPGILFVYA
jgi:hypothetical protein